MKKTTQSPKVTATQTQTTWNKQLKTSLGLITGGRKPSVGDVPDGQDRTANPR